MRILLIAIQFPPDINSTGNLMAQLAESWIARGHHVSVVTSLPHYQNFQIEAAFKGTLYQRESRNGLDILRLWVYAPGKKSMIRRLFNYLSFAVGAALSGIVWRGSWDVILCTNGSFFSGVAAWLIGAVKRIPFIYNLQDLYPEVPLAAGQLRNPWAIETLRRIESFMYRKAARVTVIAPAMRENLLAKRVPAARIEVIPNFVDGGFIRPLPRKNEFSRAHGLENKFVVMHAGNLGYVYDLESLLEAAKLLEALPDVVFVIVGDGVAKPAMIERAKNLRLSNLRFLPFQPHDQLPWLRASADVQVSLYKQGAARHSMPSKIYEIMASGRPLVASAEPDSTIRQLVDDSDCGLCVEPENSRQLADAVRALYADATLRQRLAANGRRHAIETFNLDCVASRYEQLMQAVLARGAGAARGQNAFSVESTPPV